METTDFPSIETPAVLVDLDIAARNIARYQAYCDEHGIRLRPHIKTHKLPRMAGLQLAAGAVGITCQKLSEADAMTAGTPIDDIREVSNYVDAMMYGLERMKDLPLSLRLIREMHDRLMKGSRGGTKSPGEFRSTQNWVGGTRPGNAIYVPPPVSEKLPLFVMVLA